MSKKGTQSHADQPIIIKVMRRGTSKPCDCKSNKCNAMDEAAPFPFKQKDSLFYQTNVAQLVKVPLNDSMLEEELLGNHTAKSDEFERKISERSFDSDRSETALPVLNLNEPPAPYLIPRKHGPVCALEVSILEKHAGGCSSKKTFKIGTSIDDQSGSYDVISRMVYPICKEQNLSGTGDTLKSSLKSFRLNDPDSFGKSLKENRSRIDATPVLPTNQTENVVLRLDETRTYTPFEKIEDVKIRPATKVMSVYMRTNKTEAVPSGFHKLHYTGDSCKLMDPAERNNQLLALHKAMEETAPIVKACRSAKKFPIATQVPSYANHQSNISSSSCGADSASPPKTDEQSNRILAKRSAVSFTVASLPVIPEPFSDFGSYNNLEDSSNESIISNNHTNTNFNNMESGSNIPIRQQSSTFGKVLQCFKKKHQWKVEPEEPEEYGSAVDNRRTSRRKDRHGKGKRGGKGKGLYDYNRS